MGLLDWLRRPAEAKSTPLNRLDTITVGRESSSGVVVGELSALQVATVSACVNRISLDVATMPLGVRRMDGDKSELAVKETAHRLLNSRPNPVNTSREFMQMMTAQAVLRGDAFAYKVLGSRGQVLELWPLQRREVGVIRDGYEPKYTVSAYNGRISGVFGRENIMHLRGPSMDGITGLDQLLIARNTIGLASAAQDSQAKSFRNGNRMPGYWTTDEALGEEAVDRLANQLHSATSGENQYRSPLLDNGLTYKTAGQGFRDAQMVETRRHEMIEVCAAFGVLPAVLGIDDKTQAFASVEAMFRAHLVHTLRPWLVAWEQTIDRDVLDGSGPLFAKFDTSDMERATTKERSESYRNLAETLVMTPNELRKIEGLPEIPGLDETWIEMMKGRSGLAEKTDETGTSSDSP